jgi:hypothetical protein
MMPPRASIRIDWSSVSMVLMATVISVARGNFDDTASAFEPHRKVERPERRQGDNRCRDKAENRLAGDHAPRG